MERQAGRAVQEAREGQVGIGRELGCTSPRPRARRAPAVAVVGLTRRRISRDVGRTPVLLQTETSPLLDGDHRATCRHCSAHPRCCRSSSCCSGTASWHRSGARRCSSILRGCCRRRTSTGEHMRELHRTSHPSRPVGPNLEALCGPTDPPHHSTALALPVRLTDRANQGREESRYTRKAQNQGRDRDESRYMRFPPGEAPRSRYRAACSSPSNPHSQSCRIGTHEFTRRRAQPRVAGVTDDGAPIPRRARWLDRQARGRGARAPRSRHHRGDG